MCAHENVDVDELCAACGWPLGRAPVAYPTALPAGTALQEGRYEIRAPLGRGGFAYVYEAWDRRLNGVVAIKELFPGDDRLCVRAPGSRRVLPGPLGADFAASMERFLHEGQLLLPLRHSGVVGVLDCFEENGTGYVVMQRVQGESLGARVAREGALPVAEVERIGSGIAEALAYLHARTPPILHRDLTPENVMLEPGGQPVLIDFGLAREQIERPGSRSVAFTDGYAPPEQYSRTAARGPFSDIYSLGAVLYYMVTGQTPAGALDRRDGLKQSLPESVPKHIGEVIKGAMALQSADRFTAAETVRARLSAGGGRGRSRQVREKIEEPALASTEPPGREGAASWKSRERLYAPTKEPPPYLRSQTRKLGGFRLLRALGVGIAERSASVFRSLFSGPGGPILVGAVAGFVLGSRAVWFEVLGPLSIVAWLFSTLLAGALLGVVVGRFFFERRKNDEPLDLEFMMVSGLPGALGSALGLAVHALV